MLTIILILKLVVNILWLIFLYYIYKVSFYVIIIALIIYFISDKLQTLAHELGHLFGGLVSNYHFVSLDWFFFRIYKEFINDKKLKISFKKNILHGQCIMCPNESNNSKFILYNLMGIIFNIILVYICQIIIGNYNAKMTHIQVIFIFSLIISGINKIIVNAIPCNINNIPNDCMIAILLIISCKTRDDFFYYVRLYEKRIYLLPIKENTKEAIYNTKDILYYNNFFANEAKFLF